MIYKTPDIPQRRVHRGLELYHAIEGLARQP